MQSGCCFSSKAVLLTGNSFRRGASRRAVVDEAETGLGIESRSRCDEAQEGRLRASTSRPACDRAVAQLVADGHAEEPAWTGDVSQVGDGSPSVGIDSSCQLAPSKRSAIRHARGPNPVAYGVTRPSSRTADAVELECWTAAAARFGVGMTDQLEPTRRSARVAPRGVGRAPTAKHTRSVRTGHPAERSARGAVGLRRGLQPPGVDAPEPALDEGRAHAPAAGVDWPTAVHVRFSGHETLDSWLLSEPAGFGVDCRCQPLPSQRSASVRVIGPWAQRAGVRQPRCRPGARSRRRRRACRSDVRARPDRPARPVPALDERPRDLGESEVRVRAHCEADARPRTRDAIQRAEVALGGLGSARSASSCRPSARPPSHRDGGALTAPPNSACRRPCTNSPTSSRRRSGTCPRASDVRCRRHRPGGRRGGGCDEQRRGRKQDQANRSKRHLPR